MRSVGAALITLRVDREADGHDEGIRLLTFICLYIANIFAEYNQQDATFLNLFISVRRSTCFRRVFHPSSGDQNCTYSVRYLSDQYCYLLLLLPDAVCAVLSS